jgi:putative redox protein
MTLRQYAEHKGWPLEAIEASVVYNVVDDERTSIARTVTVSPELTEVRRARLAHVAERTPVTKAIRTGTPISTTIAPSRLRRRAQTHGAPSSL